MTGFTIANGGIGIPGLKYSIIESIGFNNIQNAAHELGHRYLLYSFQLLHTFNESLF